MIGHLNIVFKALNLGLFCVALFVFFLGPGFAFFHRTRKRLGWKENDLLPVLLVSSGLVAFSAFWIYFFSPWLGWAFSLVVMGGSAHAVFKRRHLLAPLYLPLLLVLLTALFYNGLIMARRPSDSGPAAAMYVVGWQLPFDNVIPYSFAERLYKGEDPRDMGSTWRSSDRPPLQAGYWLVVKPFFRRMRLDQQGYHASGTVLQAFWVVALIVLSVTLGDSLRVFGVAFLFSLLSGFFFVNTIYVWPKLLAGSFCLLTMVYLLFRPASRQNLGIAGLSAGLAMLSHGGSAFVFLILLPWWALRHSGWRPSRFVPVLLPMIFLLLPWSLYQKLYDPPGNRLIKMHLAGVDNIDSRPALQTIVDSYKWTLPETLWKMKLYNIECAQIYASSRDWLEWREQNLRAGQFFSILHALGPLNLAFFIALPWLLLAAMRVKWKPELVVPIKILAFCGAVFLLWCFLMFPWASAVIHQGPYLLFMLLFYACSRLLDAALGKGVFLVLTAHGAIFLFVWGGFAFQQLATLGWVWLATSTIALIAATWAVNSRGELCTS